MAGPMIEFEIDVSELLRLAAAVPVLERAIEEEGALAMEESGMLLTGMVAARTPVNYGLLRSSISWPAGFETQGSILDTLRGIVGASDKPGTGGTSTATYVWYVEEGTGPHWPPAGPLKLWAIRKFGDERVGYAVQRAIAMRGTRGAHMVQKAWNEGGRSGVTRIWDGVPVKSMVKFRGAA